MKLGAEPKKVVILAAIVGGGLFLYFTGDDGIPRDDEPASRPAAAAPAQPAAALPVAQESAAPARPARVNTRRGPQEFKPVLKSRRPEDRIDPTNVDPTLQMQHLARLGAVKMEGAGRSLFDFGTAPPPKAPDPGKIIPVKPKPVPEVKPMETAAAKPAEAVKPQAPPIPLKFYGFVGRGGTKRAFFLENEDVYVATEGDVLKKRYKVVRINLNSVVMEDTQFQQQQTLPLVEQTT
jgi:hypothetical protein